VSITLAIGNKNYSSWSLRPWLALKGADIPFEEVVVPMYVEGSKETILTHSPSGKVPALKHGDITIWDSLAIVDYLAEEFPEHGLWPHDRAARAMARSICAEMHSGFVPLRKHMTMNVRRRVENFELNEDVATDVARIEQIWAEARSRFGATGPYLFGRFSAADAFYAPVVTRFVTYGIKVSPESREYMDTILNHPAMREWIAAAEQEPWTLPQFDV
jgi:glutathione S-transferase